MQPTWVRAANDQVLSTKPCLVGCVILTPDSSSNAADITLYDGESAQDPQIVTLRSPSGSTLTVRFQPQLETQRGLYIDIGSNVEEALVQFEWRKE